MSKYFQAILFSTVLLCSVFLIPNIQATDCQGNYLINQVYSKMIDIKNNKGQNVFFVFTINSVEKITPDSQESTDHNIMDYTRFDYTRLNFTVDYVLGDRTISFKKGYVDYPNENKSYKVGQQFLTYINSNYEEKQAQLYHDDGCNPYLMDVNVIEYHKFLYELDQTQCSADKIYLAKYKNHNIVCVTPHTHTKLIERDYGYFVPDLHFEQWNEIFSNQPTQIGSIESECTNNHNTLKSVGDKKYCIPIELFVKVVDKKQQTNNDHKLIITKLKTDKKQYRYPESVTVTGKFDKYIGEHYSFEGQHIPIDQENLFKLVINPTHFEITDFDKYIPQKYLIVENKKGQGSQLSFNYVINDKSENFIFWKNGLSGHETIYIEHVLTQHAMFTPDEINQFFKTYPHIAKDYLNPPIYETKPNLGFSQEDVQTIIQTTNDHNDYYELMFNVIPANSYADLFEFKQFSEQQTRDSLENANFPQIYIDRVINIVYP